MSLGEITITANAVAWYAAIVGTLGILIALLSAGTSIYVVRRDRTDLKLSATTNIMTTSPPPGFATLGPFVLINAANIGRRPIHLTAFPWFAEDGTSEVLHIVGEWRPSPELGENRSANLFAKQDKADLSKMKTINVRDETGRVWSQKIALKGSKHEKTT